MADWMASQVRQIETISVTKTIAQTRSMSCGWAIRPLSAFVRRFCYIDPDSLTLVVARAGSHCWR
jgi:hypothetical protein